MYPQSSSLPKLSIIIPAFNEAQSIAQTLQSLLDADLLHDAEILVVDDGSSDETASTVADFERVTLVSHRNNMGYGAAIRTGVRRSSGSHIVWYDADGQHRLEDLLRVYDTLSTEKLDYCIGVRDTRSHRVWSRQFGKFVLRFVVNIAAGERIQDFNSGLRGFRRDILVRYLHLLPKGFSASTTTTLIMKERGYIGAEIPIVVKPRIGQSSVKQLRDGMRTLLVILRVVLLFKPLYFFGGIGLTLILVGGIYGIIETITVRQGFPVFGALIIILGVQAFFFGFLGDQISQQRRERFEQAD